MTKVMRTICVLLQAFLCTLVLVSGVFAAEFTVDDAIAARANGMTLREMHDAGYSALLLKGAGFGAKDMFSFRIPYREIGEVFSATELKDAGWGAKYVILSGHTPQEVREAGFTIDDLRRTDVPTAEILRAGYNPRDLLAEGFTIRELKQAGYGPGRLRNAGVTIQDLRIAGISEREILKSHYPVKEMKEAGFTVSQLKNNGYTAYQLTIAGFPKSQIVQAGYSFWNLMRKKNKSIGSAGMTYHDLLRAGLTLSEIRAMAGDTTMFIHGLGLSKIPLSEYPSMGISMAELRQLIQERGQDSNSERMLYLGTGLVGSGATCAELISLGIDTQWMLSLTAVSANHSVADMIAAGYLFEDIVSAGLRPEFVSAKELYTAGISLTRLREFGYSAQDMKLDGFSARDLVKAGYSIAELRTNGFTVAEFNEAGVELNQLREGGFTLAEMKAAGITLAQLKSAGFSAMELRQNGYGLRKLLKAGYPASALKEAGFKVAGLKSHFTLAELMAAGFTTEQLVAAGFSEMDIAMTGRRNPNPGVDSEGETPPPPPLVWPADHPAMGGAIVPVGAIAGQPNVPGGGIPDVPSYVDQNTNNDTSTQSTGPGALEVDAD